ncbi:unnamed protein product [Cylindrotheca closterium]|uniref:Uncharacterized protein n=1 Tax=Cylindrotheca closterium TaxID=2856 RepID=A0AAD2CYQ7_9STRA|nr:unnamed protein product [Cylindrotheca closterium]
MTPPPYPVDNENSKSNNGESSFVYIAKGPRHSIGIDGNGAAYSWGKSNAVGQLGRPTNSEDSPKKEPCRIVLPIKNANGRIVKAYVSHGCDKDTGHSALLIEQTSATASGKQQTQQLWTVGCDRWQQLGLGSSEGGSTGYTWKGGKLWHERFTPSIHVTDLIAKKDPQARLVDVALGGDHTLVLANNGNVYGFGKGGDGQLGLVGKPFVSAPVKSKTLSSPLAKAVCAFRACSVALDENGKSLAKAGTCSSLPSDWLSKCIQTKEKEGLISLPGR